MDENNRFAYEQALAAEHGFTSWCGTDEAGRGPLAGPVYAAAVDLRGARIEGLDDSKKLSPRKRDKLFDEICAKTVWSIKSVSAREIDETDILSAAQKAMREAVAEVTAKTGCACALVDGNIARQFPIPAICVIQGDAKCASVAAASILAKVSRDRELLRLEERYPGYGFAKHKGYGTREHYAALDALGPCPEHRMTFLRKYFAARGPKPVTRGEMGESVAADWYLSRGCRLIASNYRSPYGEIDLILTDGSDLVFAEVKLRKDASYGTAAEFVTATKRQKLIRTAEFWLEEHPTGLQPRFDVVEVYMDERGTYQVNLLKNAFEN